MEGGPREGSSGFHYCDSELAQPSTGHYPVCQKSDVRTFAAAKLPVWPLDLLAGRCLNGHRLDVCLQVFIMPHLLEEGTGFPQGEFPACLLPNLMSAHTVS